jgi:preprotein translocase subunit SecA
MIDFITKSLAKVFGTKSDRDLKLIKPYVEKINAEYQKLASISDDALRAKTTEFKQEISNALTDIDTKIAGLRQQIADNPEMEITEKEQIFNTIDKAQKDRDVQLDGILEGLIPRAFAVVKETARRLKENKQLVVTTTVHDQFIAAQRKGVIIEGDKATWANQWIAAGNEVTWEMLHYDVQLIGGIVLFQGKISEMATGEGKTLVATLPAYLRALAGNGVHIVTVNDYLAKRDSEWMGPIFEFHGMKVDCIDKHQPNTEQRRNAYHADITYGTNNEFGFDYLRDNMVRTVEEMVQRRHYFAMVDEVDSVLIDDARTPLIISGPIGAGNAEELEYQELKPRIEKLVERQKRLVQDFLNEAKKKIGEGNKTEGGLALFRAHRGLPKYRPLIKFLGETGMKQTMLDTENIYLQDNSRQMPEADKPLYFTIDEKNNSVDLTNRGIDLITEQGEDTTFFVLPDLGAELAEFEKHSGSLSEDEKLQAKDKIIENYSIKTQRIHCINQLLKAYTLFEKDTEYIIDEGKVKIVDEQTGRIMDGRRYSDGLHQALEAKENVKVEEATQTYATVTLQNYFRMYHKLAGMTGTAETEAGEFMDIYKLDVVVIPTNRSITRKDHEDKVYKTVREKYNAVVDEIQEMVAKGRPVLVGTTSVENSEILSRLLRVRKINHQVLNAKYHAKEADIVAEAGKSGTVTIATNMAGRGTDIKLTPESKAAGGLAIIGTERHEARRVDRQLRGRSGRQGDTGTSQFFVSLEDNLMRLFGSGRISSIMDKLGLEEGEVIQHSMITSSIERAQRKVEENNFSIRKRLLEYDEVMNLQRKVIYSRRRNALFGDKLELDIMTMFYENARQAVQNNKGDYENFRFQVLHFFGYSTHIEKNHFDTAKSDILVDELYDEAYAHYQEKNNKISETAFPILSDIHQTHGATVKEIGVTFTDGKKMISVVCDLAKTVETKGKELIKSMEQGLVLALIDQYWKEHLRAMDDLRQQVQFAVLEQKDPLMVYKFSALDLFQDFIGELNENTTAFLSKAHIKEEQQQEVAVQDAEAVRRRNQAQSRQKLQTSKEESGSVLGNQDNSEVMRNMPREKVEVTKPIIVQKEPDRNAKVTVQYADGTIKKDVKYKSVSEDVKNGRCVVIEG